MDKYYKLAQIIKVAGKEISKESNYNKHFNVEYLLGHHITDARPERITVTDDSGYRSIIIGDIRGNVSYDTGERREIKNKGYAYLYSENAHYSEDDKRLWNVRCYPTINHIYHALKILADGNYTYKEGRYITIYEGDCGFEETKEFLSDTVNRLADLAYKDPRTAEEMVEAA